MMCTAISFKKQNTYFGRTLDYEFSYQEMVTIAPRNYPFVFRHLGLNNKHYAIIGMAHVVDNYPLYYDAMNEHGLAMAGLNFVGNASYNEVIKGATNVAQFELIAYILATCKTVKEALKAMETINIVKTAYSSFYPIAELHWIMRDKNTTIIIEKMRDGVHIYDNQTGCMTNNPPFNYQMQNLKKYAFLANCTSKPTFSYSDAFYSRGMNTIGLPGDLTSEGRFVRAAFNVKFSISLPTEEACVNQFFHILESVWQIRGACMINDSYEITIYASCMNLDKGIYYYRTYNNSTVNAVSLKNVNLNTSNLYLYNLREDTFHFQN